MFPFSGKQKEGRDNLLTQMKKIDVKKGEGNSFFFAKPPKTQFIRRPLDPLVDFHHCYSLLLFSSLLFYLVVVKSSGRQEKRKRGRCMMQNYEKGKEQRAMGDDKMKQALSSFLLGLLRSLQGSLGELGKNKAGLVDLRVVVTAQLGLLVLGPLAKGLLDVGVGILGADHESDLAAGVGGDGGETVFDSGEQLAGEAHDLLDNGHVKPDALAYQK